MKNEDNNFFWGLINKQLNSCPNQISGLEGRFSAKFSFYYNLTEFKKILLLILLDFVSGMNYIRIVSRNNSAKSNNKAKYRLFSSSRGEY